MKSLKLGLLKRGLKNIYEILEVQGVLALCIQISLVQISLLPFFFQNFQKYLAYAFLGLFISLSHFFYWLMQFWGYLFHYCNFLAKNRQKIPLMK